MENKIRKTGTTTVGLVCKDGIILAADRRMTLGGQYIVHKSFPKIVQVSDNIAVTTAGSVSDIQLLIKLTKAQLRLNKIRKGKNTTVKEAANLMSSMVYSNIRKFSVIPSITGFLMGGKDNSGYYLYNIGITGETILSKDYEADGSGMMFALGVLESEYKKNMTVSEGTKTAVKALNAALQRDAASGSGIDVITITKDGIKKVVDKEINTEFN